MKKITLIIAVYTALFSTISLGKTFDNQSFKDGYSFYLDGFSSLASTGKSKTIATGQLLADGLGHVTGTGIVRSNNRTCVSNIRGVYHIQPNGFGSLSTTIITKTPGCASQDVNLEMVLSDKGIIIDVANSDNDDMVGQLTRQDKLKFNYTDLSGAYAMHLAGTSSIVSSDQSFTTILGVVAADGNGNIGGTGLLRSAGVVCHGTFSGTYLLATNGKGSISTKFTPTETQCDTRDINLSLILYKKGNGADISSAENDYLLGSLSRQFTKN